MNTRALLFVAVVLALAAGTVLSLRAERDAGAKALALRLAEPDLAPDDAVQAARALRAIPETAPSALSEPSAGRRARPEEALTGRARLRFLLALGYTLKEQGLADVPASEDPQALAEGLERAIARERRATEEMIALAAADVPTTEAFLAASKDAEVRRRAARTLGMLSEARALPSLERALSDADEGVRGSAFAAGTAIARRAGDPTLLAAFLEAGARHPSLVSRAFDAARIMGGPRAVPVFLAILEAHTISETDRAAAVEAIGSAAGPEAAKGMPADTSAASLRAWWTAQERSAH